MTEYFEKIFYEFEEFYPVIGIFILVSLLMFVYKKIRDLFRFGGFSSYKSKSNDDEIQHSIPFEPWEEPVKVKHNRLNSYGEREYDYTQNNYECEGCK